MSNSKQAIRLEFQIATRYPKQYKSNFRKLNYLTFNSVKYSIHNKYCKSIISAPQISHWDVIRHLDTGIVLWKSFFVCSYAIFAKQVPIWTLGRITSWQKVHNSTLCFCWRKPGPLEELKTKCGIQGKCRVEVSIYGQYYQ